MTIVVATINTKTIASDKTTAGIVFRDLPKNINLIVVLIVVAIPEGLPLTI